MVLLIDVRDHEFKVSRLGSFVGQLKAESLFVFIISFVVYFLIKLKVKLKTSKCGNFFKKQYFRCG